MLVCCSLVSTCCPSRRSACWTSDSLPVRKYHPGLAWSRSAYAFMLSGVSLAGSTVIDSRRRSLPSRSANRSWILAMLPTSGGHAPRHEQKEGLDDDHLVPQEIVVEPQLLAALIDQADVREILAGPRVFEKSSRLSVEADSSPVRLDRAARRFSSCSATSTGEVSPWSRVQGPPAPSLISRKGEWFVLSAAKTPGA